MNPVDDKTRRQPIFGQRRANDPRLPRTQRRHCIEKVGDAGCSICDCLCDNGRGRLAVTDRYPHTRCGQGPDETSRNAFRRQRNNGPSGVGEFAQSLQVTRPGLHDPIWSMDARTPRTDERTFQVQAEYTVPPTDRATCRNGRLHLLAGVGDQGRQTRRGAETAVCSGNRTHAFRRRLIVEKHSAAAVDLQIDKARSKEIACRETPLRPVFGDIRPGSNAGNAPVPDHHRGAGMPAMAVKNTVRKDCVPFGD